MKKFILTIALAFTGLIAGAQNTYTNTTPGTTTLNPGQTTPPYDGTNPSGVPNKIPPTMDPNINKPLTPTVSPSTPQPNNTSPITPNTTSPVNPITPMTPNKE